MLTDIHPKLPMRQKANTREFYTSILGFTTFGNDFEGYLMLQKDSVQIHFFEYMDLNVLDNYGQIYIRCTDIEDLYNEIIRRGGTIHPNGQLGMRPWGIMEFSILDPDHNLITFGMDL